MVTQLVRVWRDGKLLREFQEIIPEPDSDDLRIETLRAKGDSMTDREAAELTKLLAKRGRL